MNESPINIGDFVLWKPDSDGGTFWGILQMLPQLIPPIPPMRRASTGLTDTAIKRSRPAAKPYKLADGKGLYLLVNPSGSKLWRWKYRHEGREKLMPFGVYPDVSLADARLRHAEARRLLSANCAG